MNSVIGGFHDHADPKRLPRSLFRPRVRKVIERPPRRPGSSDPLFAAGSRRCGLSNGNRSHVDRRDGGGEPTIVAFEEEPKPRLPH